MEIQCTQCGGKVPIEQDSDFIRCPFCETALYVETDRTVRHYYMSGQVKAKDLEPVIGRKLSYLEITDRAEVKNYKLKWLPFWRLDTQKGGTIAIPAATPPLEDLHSIKLPAGDLKIFDEHLADENEVVEPERLLEDVALEAQELLGEPEAKFKGAALMHLPMYEVHYVCQDSVQLALVDAVSGEVYADNWPANPQKKKDKVLGLIAALAFILFFLEAALLPGMGFVLIAYAVTAPLLYLLARNTLKKMGW